ncbi:MAG TPA: hypothetical protein VFX82_09535 [Desulfobacterales bacterium]|nr:hypothetical protein [Desulfobacterales bacterium]
MVIWAGDFLVGTSRGARRVSFRSAGPAPVFAALSPAGEAASPALVAVEAAVLGDAVDDGGPAAKWEHPSARSIAPDTAHKRIHRGVMHAYPNPDKPEPNSKFETTSKGKRVGATADCHVHKTETGEFVKDRSAVSAGESGAAPSLYATSDPEKSVDFFCLRHIIPINLT